MSRRLSRRSKRTSGTDCRCIQPSRVVLATWNCLFYQKYKNILLAWMCDWLTEWMHVCVTECKYDWIYVWLNVCMYCTRLHAGERWRPVKSAVEAAAGAQFMTFVLPYETLPSRRFPKFGSFAYIFRGNTMMWERWVIINFWLIVEWEMKIEWMIDEFFVNGCCIIYYIKPRPFRAGRPAWQVLPSGWRALTWAEAWVP